MTRRTAGGIASQITRVAMLALCVLSCNVRTKPQEVAATLPRTWIAQAPAGTSERRLVVELRPGQRVEDLSRAASDHFGRGIVVEPLFPTAGERDDPYGLKDIFVVRIPSASSRNPWDEAYELKAVGNLKRVEPDLDGVLERPTRDAAAACLGDQGVAAPEERGWSLREIHAKEAWALQPSAQGKRFGAGVQICHLDTGWTLHAELDDARLDLTRQRDLVDGDSDAQDPLNYRGNPGHGTATGSVIVSEGGLSSDGNTTAPGVVHWGGPTSHPRAGTVDP